MQLHISRRNILYGAGIVVVALLSLWAASEGLAGWGGLGRASVILLFVGVWAAIMYWLTPDADE
jgi:hypothetical protein